jgi:hypothetical protein
MADQSLPPTALQEIERTRALVDKLRESLRLKRDQVRIRDEAILQMSQRRDCIRAECFDLEERILDTQIRLIASYVAVYGLRLPTYIHLVNDQNPKAKGAATS